MTQQEIQNFRNRVSAFIDQRRLRYAINEIKQMSSRRLAWEIDDKIKHTEQNYAYMLRYLTNGAADPGRGDIYDQLVADIYSLLDSLVAFIESNDSPAMYYASIRYNRMRHDNPSLPAMLDSYRAAADKVSLLSLVQTDDKTANAADRREMENLQQHIFTRIWASQHLSHDDAESITAILDDESVNIDMKQMVVSALMLALLQQYDRRKLNILISTYMTAQSIKVSSAALVGMLLSLWKYRDRPLTRPVADRLAAAKDGDKWASDLRVAFIEIIRARDTERINRKMRDELIPKMEKLRPEIEDRMRKAGINTEESTSIQENPEWQEMLDKTGVTDQLKEMMEIQMEGGDVMMSTFSHLKNFPFFQTISNWFLPFDGHHSSVAKTIDGLDILGDMMENAIFLCDSDKYSFMFALESVPSSQKELMISQLKSQSAGIYQAMSDMTAQQGAQSRRMAVNSYLQNIYRFFKLFPRKSEFYDPFDDRVNLVSVKALASDFSDTELLQVVAEFYFKLKYMQDALDVYTHLENILPGDAPRYQKMGYCHERLTHYREAIDCYQRAELLDASSAWTVRRIATCYRLLGQQDKALEYYRQLAAMLPDDLGASMLYGQSLLANGDYADAIKQFYKVEFLDEKSTKAWRPLAWTLFLSGDYEGANRYYKKILMDSPTSTDYLNMGHVALASGNIRDAVNHYTMSIKATQGDTEWFLHALRDDADAIAKAGVDTSLLPLIADATLYSLE